ncbi:MAG: metalloregulator ArsR/SmtB family transcription factor [Cycloclasticus sp.]
MNNLATDELISNDTEIIKAANLLKVLSHPIRLKIICQLGHEEKTVQQLIDSVGTTQSNVSQHLSIMRERNVLQFRKSATQVFYKVSEKAAIDLVQLLKKIYC